MDINKNNDLITSLQDCITACEFCATSCLHENDVKPLAECIKLDRDCADICSLALQFVSRQSDQAHAIIELCEEICAKCAAECETHDHDHCAECAEACRRCQKHCKNYLNRQLQAKA